MQIGVLDKITYGDSGTNTGATKFEYNNFGQVKKVINLAEDGHALNYTATNLDSPGTNLTDVPRLTQTRSRVENFNGQGGIPAETVVTNDYQENQPIWGGGQGTIIKVTTPDGVIQKSHMFGIGSGWVEALPFYNETCTSAACTGSDKKRWIITGWGQDDTTLSYIENPRTLSNIVSDSGSSRRTEYTYKMNGQKADFGLVESVNMYNQYGNEAHLKQSVTEYEENPAYISRRIIGLPKTVTVRSQRLTRSRSAS